jgi:hypothetical protein
MTSGNDFPARPKSACKTLSGSCHCGRIVVEFMTALDLESFVPRACGCSFCHKHAAHYLSDPKGLITLRTAGLAEDIYRLGFEITDFHVCGVCGVLVAATWSDGTDSAFGVVNLRALNRASAFGTPSAAANFDDEDVAQRHARRRSTWTPTVVMANGS